MIGRTIAHYEITGKLGEGAMGEVYRATDTRLKRDVAIKMLSSQRAAEPERVARIRREAEVLASLNHSNIGQIYGLEPVDESLVLVLELVEGPTLEDRLAQGPISPHRALEIAHQIAAALETAHEGGIIHRDLKPANVKLMPNGDVKVLDFGLAKDIHVNETRHDLTADGAVIGTPAYMSPEQVAGKPLDRRTDIWSFGCLLYEMFAGQRAFDGESVGSLFAAIATEPADFDRVPEGPPPVRHLIERCLRKDPRSRLRDIGDARIEIEDILASRTPSGNPVAVAPVEPGGRRRVGIALAALVVGVAIGAWAAWRGPGPGAELEPPVIARYSISLPPAPRNLHLDSPTGAAPPLNLTADGRLFVFAAMGPRGVRQLYLHTLATGRTEALPGTDGAEAPFFNPEGTEVGYVLAGGFGLHRISVADKSITKVRDTMVIRGACWAEDDTIVFAESDRGLAQMSSEGKEQKALTEIANDERHHRWPQILPDGRHVLFTVLMNDGRLEPRILDRQTLDTTALDVQGSFVRYLTSGHIIYTKADQVWAIRFDLARKAVIGRPVPVLNGVYVPPLGNPYIALTADGILVYEPFRPPSPGRSLQWIDRSGQVEVLDEGEGYEFPRLSPDGKRVAYANHTKSNNHEIWMLNIERKTSTKITTEGNYVEPIWSPDGQSLVFSDFGARNLFIQGVAETKPRVLLERLGWQLPLQWMQSDKLLFEETLSGRGSDLVEITMKDRIPHRLVATVDSERGGRVSPDGRWIAYVSDKTAHDQVYLRSYPKLGPEEIVSVDGGGEPVWSHDGSELFFRHGLGMYSVAFDNGKIGRPKKLFEGKFVEGFRSRPNYDVTKDGRRFLMVEGGWGLTQNRLVVHLHFEQEVIAALAK